MSRKVSVYLYGETEPFTYVPFEVFSALERGDMLSLPGIDDIGVMAFVVRYKEAHISGLGEPTYALLVEEW